MKLQLQRLAEILDKRGLQLRVTDAALAKLAADGYGPGYGARPVKRVIQQMVQNPLATELLKGEYPEGSTVEVGLEDDKFVFNQARTMAREPATDLTIKLR